ncbi:PHP-associated domain-containing protein [Thermodesulfobacteriota bacterium]
MLNFMRNKLISVHIQDNKILKVHGILDDDIYGIELRISFDIPNLKITAINGKWNRWTTPECTRALSPLQEMVGLSMGDDDFSQKVNMIVGRKSCRHFANLLFECSHSALEAARCAGLDNGEKNDCYQMVSSVDEVEFKEANPEQIKEGAAAKETGSGISVIRSNHDKERGKGIVIDLHVHTSPASPCSSAPVDALIEEARLIGLNGICLTDHNYIWPAEVIEELRQKHGFLILGGNEVTTSQGDMLVFGLERNIEGIITVEALREEVNRVDGFMIAAHPFRGFLVFGVDQLGLTPEAAMKRPHFSQVDALEVLNSKVTENENAFALRVARGLGLLVTGGSDAHEVEEVGIYGTLFSSGIENERELIEALKQDDYAPIAFRRIVNLKQE